MTRARRHRAVVLLDRAGLVLAGIASVLFVAYVLGSLALTGGRVAYGTSPLWAPVVDWPLFVVPAEVLIWLAALGIGAFVVMARLVRGLEVRRVLRALRIGGLGFVVGPLGFTFAQPRVVGEDRFGVALTEPGWHWIAAVIGVAGVVVMLLLARGQFAEHDRLMRAGVTDEDSR